MTPREESHSYFTRLHLKDHHHFLAEIIVQENYSALSFGVQEPGVISEVRLVTPEQAQREASEASICHTTVTAIGLRLWRAGSGWVSLLLTLQPCLELYWL